MKAGKYCEIIPQPEGISKGSSYISLYIPTQVKTQTLSISENSTSSIVLPGLEILGEFIFCIALAGGPIFFSIGPAELAKNWKVFHS